MLRVSSFCLAGLYLVLAAALVSLPVSQTKIKLFALQLLLLLPAVICYGISEVKRSAQSVAALKPPRWLPYVVYLSILIPLAWLGRPGVVADEHIYLFQARIFQSGHLAAEAPLPPQDSLQLFMGNIIADGRWFTKYTPGWPLVLALGLMLHIELLWNVLLGLAALWILERVAGVLYGDPVQTWFTWIMICPYYLLNCLGYMSHPWCTLLIALSVLLFLHSCREPRLPVWFGMWLACAAAIFARPLTGACAVFVLGIFSFWMFRRDRRQQIAILASGLVCGIATTGGLLLYTHSLAGIWSPTLYAFYRGASIPAEMNFAPLNVLHNLVSLTPRGLFLTVVHTFPLILIPAVYGWWQDREQRWRPNLLLALWGILILGHVGQVDNSNSLFGDRYYFDTFFAVALLAARGCDLFIKRYRLAPASVTILVLLLCATQLPSFSLFARTELLSRRPSALLQEAVSKWPESGVVFVAPPRTAPAIDPRAGVPFQLIPRQSNFNTPDWRRQPWLFLPDPGEADRRIQACATGRSLWIVVEVSTDGVREQSRGTVNCSAPSLQGLTSLVPLRGSTSFH